MSVSGKATFFAGKCADCGFEYREHKGHIIACPVCALAKFESAKMPIEPSLTVEEVAATPERLFLHLDALRTFAAAEHVRAEEARGNALEEGCQLALELRDEADGGKWIDFSGPAWTRGFGFAANLIGKKLRALQSDVPKAR